MKEWCLGFVFVNDCEHVLLLRKSKTMHVGLWNGIGGKVEKGESVLESMVRECKEEAKLDVQNWKTVGRLEGVAHGEPWRVYIFATEIEPERMDEITADWAVNALSDKPYKVGVDSLSYMKLAPHTELMVAAARAKLKNPATNDIIIAEV